MLVPPLHPDNKPGLRFSAFKLCHIMPPPLLLSLYNYVLGGGNSLYSNLTYIYVMLLCLSVWSHFYLDFHRIHTYQNYCSDLAESKLYNFS